MEVCAWLTLRGLAPVCCESVNMFASTWLGALSSCYRPARMRKDLLFAIKLLPAVVALPGCTDPSDFDDATRLVDQPPNQFECDKQSPQPQFCDDFDDQPLGSVLVPTVWPSARPGTFNENDNTASRSGAQSLVASIDGPYDGSEFTPAEPYPCSFGRIGFPNLTAEPVRVRVSFDLRVEETEPASSSAVIAAYQFLFGPYSSFNQLVLNLSNPGGTVLAQFTEGWGNGDTGESRSTAGIAVPMGLNTWRHFVMDLDIQNPNGTGNSAQVTLDDAVLYSGPLNYQLSGSTPRMELGITWADKSAVKGPWRIRYDNLLVYIVPK